MEVFAQQLINGLVVGSTYVLIALGLTLMFGVLGIPNLAHGETYMLGAFTAYLLVTEAGLSFWVSLPVAIVIGAAVGLVVYELAFRRLADAPLITHFIAALAVATILSQLAHVVFGGGARVIPRPVDAVLTMGGVTVPVYSLIIFGIAMLGALILWGLLRFTWFGRSMRAVAQNRTSAELVGVNLRVVAYWTFAVGSALAALAGGLLGGVLPITPEMGITPVLKAFIVLVLGGIGSIPGAVAGGLFLGVVESMGAGYLSSEFRDPIAFGILIVVLVIAPTGLARRQAAH